MFTFGTVDGTMSYVYDIIHNKSSDIDNVVKKYVQVISELNISEKYILGIPPTNMNSKGIKLLPIIYNLMECEEYLEYYRKNKTKVKKVFTEKNVNMNIKKYKTIKFIDVPKIMYTKTGNLKKKYKQISPISMHIRWEATLAAYDITKFKDLSSYYDTLKDNYAVKTLYNIPNNILDKFDCEHAKKYINDIRTIQKSKITKIIKKVIPSKYNVYVTNEQLG